MAKEKEKKVPTKGWVWDHFEQGKHYLTDQYHYEARCIACIREQKKTRQESDQAAWEDNASHVRLTGKQLHDAAVAAVPAICGKTNRMKTHLRNCDYVADNVKARATKKDDDTTVQTASETPSATASGTHPDAPPRKKQRQSTFSVTSKARMTPARQQEFESDVCRLFIANDWSWNGVENPTTEMFFEKWVPGAELPSRQRLSGAILNSEAEKVRKDIKTNVEGRYATGQCDGWKNIAKCALIATMITVNFVTYCLKLHDMTAVSKTAEALLELVLTDIAYASTTYLTTIIAWCSDAGGDSRGMRRLLHLKLPRLICLDCWAHQINLIVGDYLKASFTWVGVLDESHEVIKWFNNHSRAFSLLRTRQQEDRERARTAGEKLRNVLSLFLPVATRWIAHYASVARLLEVGRVMRAMAVTDEAALIAAAGTKADAQEKAQEIIRIIERKSFWEDLAKVKFELEPLAIAQNVTQGAGTRLDHVLVTLANLFAIYSRDAYDEDVRIAIHTSLEKRWAKADQDAFIAAVFFNPHIRGALFNSDHITAPQIYGILKRLYKRVFETDASTDMYTAFNDYRLNQGQFSDDALCLAELQDAATKEGKDFPILEFWRGAQTTKADGSSQFARLAMLVLSIVANSAETERLWSRMGNIHTKLRNRLGAQKVHDTAMIKMDIQRNHIKHGRLRPRLKRKIGRDDEPEDTPSASTAAVAQTGTEQTAAVQPVDEDEQETETASQLADRLERDLVDDDLDDIDLVAPQTTGADGAAAAASATGSVRRVVMFFGTQRPITLAQLFDYTKTTTTSSSVGLDIFWKAAKTNLERELEYYDLLAAGGTDNNSPAPQNDTGSSNSTPIVIE